MIMIISINNFFEDPIKIRELILKGQFNDLVSPWDAVTYPGIQSEVDPFVKEEFIKGIEYNIGLSIDPQVIFVRETSGRTKPAPNYLHSDRVMGQYSAHVYISLEWPQDAGTMFWRHNIHGDRETANTDILSFIQDVRNLIEWHPTAFEQGEFNHGVIHDATLYHSAEPYGGWGTDAENGRLVLTCFFNVKV